MKADLLRQWIKWWEENNHEYYGIPVPPIFESLKERELCSNCYRHDEKDSWEYCPWCGRRFPDRKEE